VPTGQAAREELAAEVGAIDWYHTLELAPGVVTPGWLDTRAVAGRVPFPPLEGKRCLDVGTFNGFWAFEMERRAAKEVIGIDLLDPQRWDWPTGSEDATVEAIAERQAGGRGFEIAKRELGSSVERLDLSVYDLDPEEVGRFDVVYLGSLLVHLREPVRALERVRSVCAGQLIVVDGVDPLLSLLLPRTPVARLDARGRPWWWYANVAGLARMAEAAGFELAGPPERLYIPPGPGREVARLHPRLLFSPQGREEAVVALKGDPHAMLLARPRT
jgi:tRNA (mo5U34)-methyltransferase